MKTMQNITMVYDGSTQRWSVNGQNVSYRPAGHSYRCYCDKFRPGKGCQHTALLKQHQGYSYLTDRETLAITPKPGVKHILSLVSREPIVVMDNDQTYTIGLETCLDDGGSMYFKRVCSCGYSNCRHIRYADEHITHDEEIIDRVDF